MARDRARRYIALNRDDDAWVPQKRLNQKKKARRLLDISMMFNDSSCSSEIRNFKPCNPDSMYLVISMMTRKPPPSSVLPGLSSMRPTHTGGHGHKARVWCRKHWRIGGSGETWRSPFTRPLLCETRPTLRVHRSGVRFKGSREVQWHHPTWEQRWVHRVMTDVIIIILFFF